MKIFSPSGDILEHIMDNHRVGLTALVEGSGVPLSCVESILGNKHPIAPEVAERFGEFFGTTIAFWTNSQNNYDHQPGVQPMQVACALCDQDRIVATSHARQTAHSS